ncbi:MAG: hypothetical protein L3J39_08400 [Verrucomicrobiales bacterium]|nr:hypothetical protein [Verrucomicrobiales bacterium]
MEKAVIEKGKTAEPMLARYMSLILGDGKEQRGLMLFLLVLLVSCMVLVLSTGEDWARAISDRVEAGKSIKLVHYMHAGWWWSAAVDGALLAVLLLSRKLWYFESEKSALQVTSGVDRWRWYAWILLILIAAVFVRGPRMDLSLYNDEADVFERYIGGSFKGAARDLKTETLPDYHQVTWSTTFWGNHQGNNHVFYSVLSRSCFALDQWWAGRAIGEIHEWPLRLPALVGGLLSIFMVAVLLKRLSRSEAGIFAAGLLAMHPCICAFLRRRGATV